MGKIKVLLRNTSLNLTGYIYLLAASFISIPMLERGLGNGAFAQYLLLAALPPLLSVLDLGVSQAVIRALAAEQGRAAKKIVSVSYFYFLVNALVLSVLAYFGVGLIGKSPIFGRTPIELNVTLALAVSVFMNQVLTHFLAVAQSQNRFGIFNLKTFIVGTANTLLAGMLAIRGGGLVQIFSALAVSYLITLAAAVYILDRGRAFLVRPRLDMQALGELLDYGLRRFIGTLSGQLEMHSGKYALAGLSGLAVGAFTIPQMIMYRAAGAISQCALALFPLSSSLTDPVHRTKLRSMYYHLQAGIFGLSMIGVILAHTVGGPFLAWWLSDTQLVIQAVPVLRTLSFFFVLLSLTPIASTIMDSLGYPQYTSFSAVLTAVLNILLLVLLTPRYGAQGAAYAILISSLITTPVFLFMTERVLQSNKLKY